MMTIKKESRGEEVRTLQKKLHLLSDGIFGQLTEEAVKEFQRENSLIVDGIVGSKTWEALGVDTPVNNRNIDEIIVHYSATPEDENFTVDQIRQIHIQRGFSDIGYHWYIDLYGNVWKGRDERLTGAHCLNHNTRSIGICYCGGCPPRSVKGWQHIGKDTRTPAQRSALINLIKEVKRRYPKAVVHGHNEFANKPCPGFNAKEEFKNI